MIGHRRCLPETTYLVTKKCNDDLFLLKPTQKVRSALRYELSKRAKRYRIKVHAHKFMRNHFHLVVTDSRGNLPAFMRDFLTNTSKALQIALEIRRPIWSRKRYSDVHLLELDAAERKVAYTVLNPTRALQTLPWNWPGVSSAGWPAGSVMRTRRPNFYYDPRYNPLYVELTLEPVAPEFGLTSPEAIYESEKRIAFMITLVCAVISYSLSIRGRSFAGAKAAAEASIERRGKRRVRHLNPQFATRNKELMKRAIEDRRAFEDDHERAKQEYLAGNQRVQFPSGTYGYRMLLGVRVRGMEALS